MKVYIFSKNFGPLQLQLKSLYVDLMFEKTVEIFNICRYIADGSLMVCNNEKSISFMSSAALVGRKNKFKKMSYKKLPCLLVAIFDTSENNRLGNLNFLSILPNFGYKLEAMRNMKKVDTFFGNYVVDALFAQNSTCKMCKRASTTYNYPFFI